MCDCNRTRQERRGPHLGEYCADCGRWLRWLRQRGNLFQKIVMPYGPHKGENLAAIGRRDPDYLTKEFEVLFQYGGRR